MRTLTSGLQKNFCATGVHVQSAHGESRGPSTPIDRATDALEDLPAHSSKT